MPDFFSEADEAARRFAKTVAGKQGRGVPIPPSIQSTETTMEPSRFGLELLPELGISGGGGGGGVPPPTGDFVLLTDFGFLLNEAFEGILEA